MKIHSLILQRLNGSHFMKHLYCCVVLCLLFSCKESNKDASPKKNIATNIDEHILDSLKNKVSQYPDSFSLKEDLLWTLRDSAEFSTAIGLAKSYLSKDSNNQTLWHIYADLLAENLDTSNAIAAFEKSLCFERNTDDLIPLGQFYAATKNPAALKIVNELLMIKDAKIAATAHLILGNYYAATNRTATAMQEYDKSLSINFTFMEAYLSKAMLLMDEKKYEEAIKVLQRATTLKNSFDEGYYYLGQCFEKINNNDMAIDAYRKALLYSPNYEEASSALKRLTK